MTAASPYLNRPKRSEAEARADAIAAHQAAYDAKWLRRKKARIAADARKKKRGLVAFIASLPKG